MPKLLTLVLRFAYMSGLLALASVSIAQTGSIEGLITDSDTGEPFEFCYLSVYQDEILISGHEVWRGEYSIHDLAAGEYTIVAFYVDVIEFRTSCAVVAYSTTRLDFSLTDCSDYQKPEKACPEGHTNGIAEIVYGLAIDSKKNSRKVRRGKLIHAGCDIPPCPSYYYCRKHDVSW